VIRPGVSPVDVPSDPVNCHSIRPVDLAVNYHLLTYTQEIKTFQNSIILINFVIINCENDNSNNSKMIENATGMSKKLK